VIGAFILRAALGVPKESLAMMPGCYIDPKLVTPGEAFGLEAMSSFFQLFLAFGLGLDPRNNTSFGPSLGPFLIGLSSALTLFMGGIARPGYFGSSNNPARCLGLNAASGRFVYHYVFWAGDIAAVL
jgi:glycerol uptake facilitator-like aquaporin